jgi:hypothetical protein
MGPTQGEYGASNVSKFPNDRSSGPPPPLKTILSVFWAAMAVGLFLLIPMTDRVVFLLFWFMALLIGSAALSIGHIRARGRISAMRSRVIVGGIALVAWVVAVLIALALRRF